MNQEQALVAAMIGLAATIVALGLVALLWWVGLWLLDLLSSSRASFELIVALRHLRGRKSGYLKAMTAVVLLAMTMVNCSLPTVLSVMGGFGNDLKQKILDATAHVLVDLERPELDLPAEPTSEDFDRIVGELERFPETAVVIVAPRRSEAQAVAGELLSRGVAEERVEIRSQHGSAAKQGVRVLPASDDRSLSDYEEIADRIEGVDGVVGVTPFIDADVMLASQTNIASVVLKGVDPESMHDVIGLRDTVEQGSLEYLDEPDRILEDVLAEQERRLQLLLADAGIDEPDAGGEGVLRAFPEEDAGVGSEAGADVPDDARPDAAPSGELALPDLVPPPPELVDGHEGEGGALPAVIVGRELAKTLRVFVGDEVNVVSPLGGMGPLGPIPKTRPYRVGGVFYSGMYQDDAKNAYVRLDVAQRFLGMEGRVSGIRVRVEELEQADAVAARIEEELGDRYRVRPWQEVNANLFSALRLEKIAMFAVYSIFFIICAFLIASTLTMMVLEKRRGLAVLKTLGASNRRLGAVFMLQGLLAGVVGTISGQVAGLLTCLALGRFVEIEPEVYYIDRLPVNVEPLEFATVAGVGLLTAAVATLVPLLATVVLRPVDGLRQ